MILLVLQQRRTAAVVIATAAIWLYLCATPRFDDLMRRGLEYPYPNLPPASYPVEQALVILGGDHMLDPDNSWQHDPLRTSQNRLGFGYLLYRAHRARLIVVSAGKGGAIKMAKILESKGIPAACIIVESHATNTYENALYTSRLLKRQGIRHILLVTSPYHMRRSIAAFRKQGMEPLPAPTLPLPAFPQTYSSWLPYRDVIPRSRIYLHEYLGSSAYRLLDRS